MRKKKDNWEAIANLAIEGGLFWLLLLLVEVFKIYMELIKNAVAFLRSK